MARAVERTGRASCPAWWLTRYGYAVPCEQIEIVESAHPVPDAAARAPRGACCSCAGALCGRPGAVPDLRRRLFPVALPLPGLTLEDKQSVSRALLKSGASISEMNCVRRHLSAVKGGRLAAACHPARVLTLLISDVPGDNPIDIASGPTTADPTSCADALEIIRRYGIEVPRAVREILESGQGESVKPGDARLARATTRLIATPQNGARSRRRRGARRRHSHPAARRQPGRRARDVGKVMAASPLGGGSNGHPHAAPCLLLSGGETTVTVRGQRPRWPQCRIPARPGHCARRPPGIWAIAGDTDGVDGAEERAGALLAPDSLARALAQGINPKDSLANNDGHGFFTALDDSVVTGPTLTNVNDFRAILITAEAARGRHTNMRRQRNARSSPHWGRPAPPCPSSARCSMRGWTCSASISATAPTNSIRNGSP